MCSSITKSENAPAGNAHYKEKSGHWYDWMHCLEGELPAQLITDYVASMRRWFCPLLIDAILIVMFW
jgi:hypothetical protein